MIKESVKDLTGETKNDAIEPRGFSGGTLRSGHCPGPGFNPKSSIRHESSIYHVCPASATGTFYFLNSKTDGVKKALL